MHVWERGDGRGGWQTMLVEGLGMKVISFSGWKETGELKMRKWWVRSNNRTNQNNSCETGSNNLTMDSQLNEIQGFFRFISLGWDFTAVSL